MRQSMIRQTDLRANKVVGLQLPAPVWGTLVINEPFPLSFVPHYHDILKIKYRWPGFDDRRWQ